jgi:hypothetical protein
MMIGQRLATPTLRMYWINRRLQGLLLYGSPTRTHKASIKKYTHEHLFAGYKNARAPNARNV